MKFSFNWLQEYVTIPVSPEVLAERLTMAGFEVESLTPMGHELSNVVTGKLTEIRKHPDADRLQVCQVFDGTTTHQIVTGAPNVFEGAIVPVSLPGATLAGGLTIKAGKLRGLESNGMLCSEKELGVTEEAEGIWILPPDTPLGVDFISYASLKDTILEVSILPNRGDAQSILGLAREIAVLFKTPLRLPDNQVTRIADQNPVKVQISDRELCRKYSAQWITDVQLAPAPLWMQRRLQASGIRPINNVVDITNYVLLECGQPLHAFDADRLSAPEIDVRLAKAGEVFVTLDGQERTLKADTLLICNAGKPVALAGVMGGLNSEIQDTTTRVLLESAWFQPGNIRKTEMALGLRTESAIRFEKGVDYPMVGFASNRAAHLLQQFARGKVHTGIAGESLDNPPETHRIAFRPEAINALLGSSFSAADMTRVLTDLGYTFEGTEVTVPTWRLRDVMEFPDLAEDIARILGYDTVPVTHPERLVPLAKPGVLQQLVPAVEHALVEAGFHQVVTFSFINPADLAKLSISRDGIFELANPLTIDESVMRPHLLPSLLNVMAHNIKRQINDLKLFECGKIFRNEQGSAVEELVLSGLVTGHIAPGAYTNTDKAANTPDLAWLKGIITHVMDAMGYDYQACNCTQAPYLHPGQQTTLCIGDICIGEAGLLHPGMLQTDYDISQPILYFQINLTRILELPAAAVRYQAFSRFPSTRRDISMIVPNTLTFGAIMAVIDEAKHKTVINVQLFDRFESEAIGSDNTSLAVGFTYQHPDRTLSDEEVNQAQERLCRILTQKLPVTIR